METPKEVKLLVEDGRLYTPREAITQPWLRDVFSLNPILVCLYPAGDCDTIKWPNPNEEHLRSALYDARETGVIPNVPSVTLPDGSTFTI